MNHMYGVRFASHSSRMEGNGIPCLVITDREGRILAHSYRGSEYIGPTKPKDLLSSFLTNSKNQERAISSLRVAIRLVTDQSIDPRNYGNQKNRITTIQSRTDRLVYRNCPHRRLIPSERASPRSRSQRDIRTWRSDGLAYAPARTDSDRDKWLWFGAALGWSDRRNSSG